MKVYALKNFFPLPSVKVSIGHVCELDDKAMYESYIEAGIVRPALGKDKEAPSIDLPQAEKKVKAAEKKVTEKTKGGKGMLKGITD